MMEFAMEGCGCPGSGTQDFRQKDEETKKESGNRKSQLKQWPIQMHLVSPAAPYYQRIVWLIA
jgi:hypothetical protein